MNPADRNRIVRELQAEMRARLASRTADNARDTDASILLFSNVLKALTAEQAVPSVDTRKAA